MGFGGTALPFPLTLAETASAVVPVDFTRTTEPYDIRRYGAKLNNSADDTSSLVKAVTVAGAVVNGAIGGAVTVPTGVSFLSTTVQLIDRVRVLGQNKRGSYFQATGGWSVGSVWNSGTAYVTGNYVTLTGTLYIATQPSTNQTPPNTTFWAPITNAMFFANNGFTAGVGNSSFDSTLENLTVDASNINNLGCILSSAWQEDCGLRGALLINFGSYGVKFQDGFGGASLSKIVDTEIFGGSVAGQTITGISVAASAVVTVSTASTLNPFVVNEYSTFSGVAGMTQINGLFGKCTAIGGSSGAWTGTFNINSSGFSTYTSGGLANDLVGIDMSAPMGSVGAFMLDVSNTSIVGGSGGNLAAGIVCNGNSMLCRQVHFETCTTGILLDGTGHITLEDVNGAGGGSLVTTLVTIASTFTGTVTMKHCRRNGATNFLVDLRTNGLGTITGQDYPFLEISPGDAGPLMFSGILGSDLIRASAPGAATLAWQADGTNGYIGTTSNHSFSLMMHNIVVGTINTARAWNLVAPTGGNHTIQGLNGTHSLQHADSATTLFNTGFLETPLNTQNAAYTLVLADSGKCIYHSDGTARTYTIPANASVAYPIGTVVEFDNDASAAVNVTIAITTDTLVLSPGGTTGSRTLAQFGRARARKVTATRWIISGSGLT